MKRLYFILRSFIIGGLLFGSEIPFNFTILPGINLFPGQSTTNISLGLISSEVYKLNGIQLGPIYSLSSNGVDGVQVAGVFNISDEIDGLQAAGVFNLTNRVDGFQVGGVFNISDNIDGFQTGGVFNIAKNVDGFQVAGVFNIAENIDGFQTGGVFNISRDVNGLQTACVINVAKNVKGAQIGVINIAESGSNLQVGVINIVSKDSRQSTPIGLLNIYRGGTFDVLSWMDTDNYIYQGLDTGSTNFYTQFYTGATKENFQKIDERIFGTAVGFKLNTRPLELDITLGAKYKHNSESYKSGPLWIPETKATLGLKLRYISIFGGVSGDFQINGYNNDSDFFSDQDGYVLNDSVEFHYKWIAGVKLHF